MSTGLGAAIQREPAPPTRECLRVSDQPQHADRNPGRLRLHGHRLPGMDGGDGFSESYVQHLVRTDSMVSGSRSPRSAPERPDPTPLPPSSVRNDASVAYDEDLANRIRELIAGEPDVTEKPMFGGLAFLVGGKMSVAASSQGGLLVRVDPVDTDALLAKPHARRFEMRGRGMQGWLRVDGDGLRTKRQLEPWVRRGVGYARSLPSKR
jgi:TfoX/Sxy family transcriptional regulator of competence genes